MYKILLVDDEILVREAIRDRLEWEKLGFELIGDCENGKKAIEFLQTQSVDVVLTDIYMPYVDGLELSKHISEEYPETKIIIFSGYSDFEYAQQALKYNVADYILKPVTAKELSAVLRKIKEKLDGKQQEKQQLMKLAKTYQTYRKNESYIVAKILSNLIKGSVDVATARKELAELGVEITGTAYRVAILNIETNSESIPVNEEKRKKDTALQAYAISNIANEIMTRDKSGIAFQDSDNLIYLLFYSDHSKDFNLQVPKVCYQIQTEVAQVNQELCLSIGIGTYTNSLEELHKSYQSVQNALAYQQTKGLILDMEDVVRSTKERQTLLAVDYLHKNYNNSELTLQDVCKHLAISTSHFSNLFKEETGKTFLEFLNRIRMDEAKQLLRKTSLKNYEIAERVGFSDPHYFNIAFKKATGKTPKKYAREYADD